MWRPKGWGNPSVEQASEVVKVTGRHADPKYLSTMKVRGEEFEAGADAILKAVIERLEGILENKMSDYKNPSEVESGLDNFLEEISKDVR